MNDVSYQFGFGNEFESEAIKGALPRGQNNPQHVAHGLYAEQLSGSAFTAMPEENLRSWLYRLLPSVVHTPFEPLAHSTFLGPKDVRPMLNQLRWDPIAIEKNSDDFIDGMTTWLANGSIEHQQGSAVHYYRANRSMVDKTFFNADGELLIVPQQGALTLATEFGVLHVPPGDIAVVPRGIKFQVTLSEPSRGYVCENFGLPFRLPYRGPIGANGLANRRDFRYPTARFRDVSGRFALIAKYGGTLWQSFTDHDPLNVVAWSGNYAPYAYSLKLFNTINTVSYDHPDPSIFTVLTSPSPHAGVANVDFVIFPPRWMVAEHTFRPPYFHRNIMSEYMGLIHGVYDAKPAGGFEPGGGSLHNCMSAHGPEFAAWKAATARALAPEKIDQTMAFMFESSLPFGVTTAAMTSSALQKTYHHCWQGFPTAVLT